MRTAAGPVANGIKKAFFRIMIHTIMIVHDHTIPLKGNIWIPLKLHGYQVTLFCNGK